MLIAYNLNEITHSRFQEVVPLSAGNVLGAENNGPAARWQHLIRHTLNYTSCNSGSFRRSCSTPSSLWQETSMDFTDTCNQELGGINLTSFASRGTPVPSPVLNSRSSSGYRSCQNRSRYAMIASKQMVGLFVSVWVKSDLRRSVRNVKVSCIGCGLMGYLGNKVKTRHTYKSFGIKSKIYTNTR